MDPGLPGRKEDASADVDAELDFHFTEVVERLVERGWPIDAARGEARRRFGNRARYRDTLVRLSRRGHVFRFDALRQDARYAVRTLIRNPAFSLVALLALALGIGATTAVFSVVNAVLLRPLPFAEPDRLVMTFYNTPRGGASLADFLDWRGRSRSFDSLEAFEVNPFTNNRFTWTGDGEPEKVIGYRVTAGFFRTLGVQPIAGRTFDAGEDAPGRPGVVVLSERFWRRRYGASLDILGRQVMANGSPHTIVGVVSRDFEFWDRDSEIWAILPLDLPTRRGPFFIRGLARLKPGATFDQASAEMNLIAGDIVRAYPQLYNSLRIRVIPLREIVVGNIRPLLWILSGAVALVLLIAVSNVANLTLGRASGRTQEIAIRLSIGASRGQLVRQLMMESIVLALMGGTLGTALAIAGVMVLRSIGPADLPRLGEISVNPFVLAFTLSASLASAAFFGLIPSVTASGQRPGRSLRDGTRAGESRRNGRTRAVLVAGQVTMSVLLLIGAGLLIRSFSRLSSVDAGFTAPPEQMLMMLVSPTGQQFRDPARLSAYWDRLLERVRGVPGVEAASLSSVAPPDRSNFGDYYEIAGRPISGNSRRGTNVMPAVSHGYLQTLGIPLRSGRWFTETDTRASAPVTVISEALARRDFGAESPLGQRIEYAGRSLEIVGVVGNVKYRGLQRDDDATFYQLASQNELWDLWLLARTSNDAHGRLAAVREAVRSVDSGVPVDKLGTMAEAMSESVALARFRSLLMTVFATTALLLAAIGIYGVVAYAVAKRSKEIGLRMALGATPAGVVSMVVGQASRPVIAGVAAGLLAALWLSRVLETMLFGVTRSDALTFFVAIAVLGAAGAAACLVPALKAARIDPLSSLRGD